MRPIRHLLAPVLLAFAPTVFAAPPVSLPAWEQLTPAQREQLIAPMRDRWNAEPAQRQRMLAHAQRWQQLSSDERQRARHGVKRWQQLEPGQREQMRAVFDHLRRMPEAERKVFTQKWRAMSAEQKREWLKANPVPTRRMLDRPTRD